MEKNWYIQQTDDALTTALQAALKVNRTLCGILVQRGIDDFEKAKAFFRPQLADLHDPWLMKDMDKAVKRVLEAINGGEKILVFGDYDVDGTTSVASMYQYLHAIYDQLDFYIPHRYREGYGISKAGIDFAHENGFTLIISLDCGIKSVELIQYAKELGIDFVICDHHLPGAELPAAVAILNPKQADCPYPYKELCGCGVGLKLMMALSRQLQLPDESYLRYLDLAATAIAADIVPITGENRIIAFHGLKKVNENPCAGIKALMQLAGAGKYMHITNLVFMIAPRVNAAGRMDDARKAVQLFIETDEKQALLYAEMLHSDNADRREADSTITEEALALIEADPLNGNRKTTVVFKEHWHKGVVGIVASRLIEKYYRPTIVLTRSGDYVAGSARSVAGFNLYEAIYECREHLLGYGGHFAAAGMTLLPENVAAFAMAFENAVTSQITDDLLVPQLLIDAEIQFAEITPSFYNIITQMEPFGPQNMRPVFIAKRVTDTGFSKIVKDQHIRFVLKQGKHTLTGIGFNMAAKFALLQQSAPVDIAFTIDENDWNGEKSLQLKIIDLRASN
ncbi:single-stranded-DNA-specific exonuclease RecJ [Sediminibacterium ginsengisoli]|uniref:Single-stranded-DNA-specific exonuclease RecJ n=1 Tax=Sediminibacterium ginsengisoli TaxID=413434 RepID=A0A1T4KMV7_9BACT|nr:single-stranded-DNA-specific exonuclease RecJ [Sediminibacterium ginsengisoli]SJZ43703.1 exonuclease RecJ [Sediminibacterium ginsengisoli]